MKLRILFIGYWNLDDGLTKSTIFPHLKILKTFDKVEYLHFANTQRESATENSIKEVKTLVDDYTSLYSKNLPFNHLNKVFDFIHFPKLIKLLCSKHSINLIIARGAPAGSLAYLATLKNEIPFIVESFEPHADYMRMSGEWKFFGVRYLFQKYWENQQKKYAKALITVAENYRLALIKEGIRQDRIYVAPCAVDLDVFFRDERLRVKKRNELNISQNAALGVYAGKFGGLYLEEEAFKIFVRSFKEIERFELLILSIVDKVWLQKMIQKYKLPSDRIHIRFVPYNKVNDYLNAADFAYALYKSNSVSQFLSPVKFGEYWACGLPVFCTQNLGDETHWIEKEGLGKIISEDSTFDRNVREAFDSSEIVNKAKKIRSIEIIDDVYRRLLSCVN